MSKRKPGLVMVSVAVIAALLSMSTGTALAVSETFFVGANRSIDQGYVMGSTRVTPTWSHISVRSFSSKVGCAAVQDEYIRNGRIVGVNQTCDMSASGQPATMHDYTYYVA